MSHSKVIPASLVRTASKFVFLFNSFSATPSSSHSYCCSQKNFRGGLFFPLRKLSRGSWKCLTLTYPPFPRIKRAEALGMGSFVASVAGSLFSRNHLLSPVLQ